MHQLVEMYVGWSAILYTWARTAVGILLWFWVISGAIFVLRFLTFMLMDRNSETSALAAASNHFSIDRFNDKSRLDSGQE
jgi:hypothetical protein